MIAGGWHILLRAVYPLGYTEALTLKWSTMNSIDVHTLAELDELTLIDVREAYEYASGHAPTAVNLPLSELVARSSEIPRDGIVYIICESGGRSAQATEWLEAQGVMASNVLGGTSAWRAAGLPLAMEGN